MTDKKDIKSISYLNEHTEDLISQLIETREPLFLALNSDTKAVLLDIDSYEKLLEAANLNKMISFKSDEEKQNNQSDEFIEQSQFFKEFKDRIKE